MTAGTKSSRWCLVHPGPTGRVEQSLGSGWVKQSQRNTYSGSIAIAVSPELILNTKRLYFRCLFANASMMRIVHGGNMYEQDFGVERDDGHHSTINARTKLV